LGRKSLVLVDFFVETLLFYLKALNDTHGLSLEITSERAVRRQRGAPRPDISIWRNDIMIAAIECKTQLGWSRNTWQTAFEARTQQLQTYCPNTQTFLVVMTTENWSGFGDSPHIGKQFFALSKVWPTKINPENIDPAIGMPIEPLFKHIALCAEAAV
jgi:hypothetical protein